MTTRQQADSCDTFLQQVKTAQSPWVPPIYPALDSPAWALSWESATDDEKHNLARAWFWRFSQMPDTGGNEGWGRVRSAYDNYRWIAQIRPYITQDFLNSDALGHIGQHMSGILGFEAGYTNSLKVLLQLWFGEPIQQREALLDIANRQEEVEFHSEQRVLVHFLARDISDHPQAHREHQLACARLSVAAGYHNRDYPKTMASAETYDPWFVLGTYCSRGQHKMGRTYRHDQVELDQAFTAISNGPCDVAAHNMAYVLARADLNNLPYCLNEKTSEQADHADMKPTVYDILRAWIPLQKTRWTSCEAIGMTAVEACHYALLPESALLPTIQLPENVTTPMP